jgi:thioredoxin reductase/Pyruvate/2-oxoacid:ferredoxin oxidoreductase delta subunit
MNASVASPEKPGPAAKVKRGKYLATVPPQEILPIVDKRYESNVRGIFLVGDVTGLPLVKVAANQGHEVIEGIEKAGIIRSDGEAEGLDLVIIGGGPAGISAAIEAAKRGWKYVVLERSKVASTVRSFPPGKKVYAEPRSIENISELQTGRDLDKDEFLQLVQEAVERHDLNIKEGTDVSRVRKLKDGTFEVEIKGGSPFPCRNVLVAVGRQGQPRLLNVPGADMAHKVTYRFHTVEDYKNKNVLVVGGGNSAIEAALMLKDANKVTLAYRGDNLYRAKEENRQLIDEAIAAGELTALFESNVVEVRENEVDIDVAGTTSTIANDNVVIQIGSLPPIDFLHDMGLELDGIWTKKRFAWAVVGLLVGIFVYFIAKSFVLLPGKAGEGKWLIPILSWLDNPSMEVEALNAGLASIGMAIRSFLPIPWLILAGIVALNVSLANKRKPPLVRIPGAKWILGLGALLYYFNWIASTTFTIDPAQAGPGPYYLPGFSWLFAIVPSYFANLGGLYYLLYFSAIAGFGLYWAKRIDHPILWRRNLTIIAVQWTLWWGIPTFLVVFIGTNPWTPLISRSVNAWPLKIDAFSVDPSIVRPGDPEWWYSVAVVGVVWAVVLTFIIIPIFTIKWGKIYCSYICSCGALAETVGNSFRHRGPKGDTPRKLEKFGFVFIALAAVATIASLLGFEGPLKYYNVWVGTFLAGAAAIGLYPFLGQRIWCRMWCPLAFWMNFWGRWSKFKISPEKGKCIDCNVCNQYCQMGIDIRGRALQGIPVTLRDTPCVGCAECVMRCPMEILHLGDAPGVRNLLASEQHLPIPEQSA